MENNMKNKQDEPVLEVQTTPSELSSYTFEHDGFIYEMPKLPMKPINNNDTSMTDTYGKDN